MDEGAGRGRCHRRVPQSVVLDQNYPNPLILTTQIRYGLPRQGHVVLTIHNILGQEVARLVDEMQAKASMRPAGTGPIMPGPS